MTVIMHYSVGINFRPLIQQNIVESGLINQFFFIITTLCVYFTSISDSACVKMLLLLMYVAS